VPRPSGGSVPVAASHSPGGIPSCEFRGGPLCGVLAALTWTGRRPGTR